MKKYKNERGEIMIEGMIVMIITMLLLVWILAVGFLYYQRYLVTATTNDVAAKIASTFNNPDSDIIMGYIETDELANRDLYRNFTDSSLVGVNEQKAKAYVEYMLNKTNFAGTIENVNVKLELIQDSAVRKHVKITTECTFNTPFGSALELFGMDATVKYGATGRADCTDIIDYISTVDFASYQLNGKSLNSDIIKMISSLVKLCNHKYAKK